MREIKFRAWDKENKEMIDPGTEKSIVFGMYPLIASKVRFYDRIVRMLMKRKITSYLNECEDTKLVGISIRRLSGGVGRKDLILHVLENERNYTEDLVDKMIDDCIEDEWIGQKHQTLELTNEPPAQIELLYVRS